jgi:hypothetical protein
MESAAERRKRRQDWTGGIASNHREMARINAERWEQVEPLERLALVFEMWFEQSGEAYDEATYRLHRSVGGVRALRG